MACHKIVLMAHIENYRSGFIGGSFESIGTEGPGTPLQNLIQVFISLFIHFNVQGEIVWRRQ